MIKYYNDLFDMESKLAIPGYGFRFPFNKIVDGLDNAIPQEELRRASLIMQRYGDYLDSWVP